MNEFGCPHAQADKPRRPVRSATPAASLAARGLALGFTLAGALVIPGCGGGSSSPAAAPAAATGATLAGAVVDGPVAGATVTAYALSANGSEILPPLATATTSSVAPNVGAYSLSLPATFNGGPVLVTSSGGSFVDDDSGATEAAGALSVLLPNVAAGASTVSAQLTPVTTLAAQVAQALAAQSGNVGSAATSLNTLIGAYLGGQSDIVGTALVDISTANCGAAASGASTDASLVLAGLSQLAATNQVSLANLIQALEQDIESDGVLDGYASGAPLSLPTTTTPPGSTTLCRIEGDCLPLGAGSSSLPQALAASITAFASSAANACGLQPSAALMSALQAPPPPQFAYTVGGTFTNLQGGGLVLSLNGGSPLTVDSDAPFTFPAPLPFGAAYDVEVATQPPGQLCTPSSNQGTIASANVGTVSIACSLTGNAYALNYTVSGLSGTGLVLSDGFGLQTVTANQASGAFATALAAGSPYTITVTTQPSQPAQTCTVVNGSGTVSASNATAQVQCSGASQTPAVYVIDATNTLFAFDGNGVEIAHVSLPSIVSNLNGGGITTDANHVYVTIGQSSSVYLHGAVVAFDKTTLAPAALPAGSFGSVDVPRGIVYDANNAQFYVGNGGSTITVYGAGGNLISSWLNNGSIDAIYGPSGLAFDTANNSLWVANDTGQTGVNPVYGVTEFHENGGLVQTPAPGSQFRAPINPAHELPYAIAYCSPASTGGSTGTVVVGFLPDNSSGGGVAEAAIYTPSGTLLAALSPQLASNAQPNAISCSSSGAIYVAADDGLHLYSVTGVAQALPANGFQTIRAPIFGVFVAD